MLVHCAPAHFSDKYGVLNTDQNLCFSIAKPGFLRQIGTHFDASFETLNSFDISFLSVIDLQIYDVCRMLPCARKLA